MSIYCQLSGGHKTEGFLFPFIDVFERIPLFVPSFFHFFVVSNLTNDRVANPFSLYLETPSISKMH